jgi:hypothetical protein
MAGGSAHCHRSPAYEFQKHRRQARFIGADLNKPDDVHRLATETWPVGEIDG